MTCQLSMISAFDLGKRTVRTCGRPFGFMRGVPSGSNTGTCSQSQVACRLAGKPPAPGDPLPLDRDTASRSRQVGPQANMPRGGPKISRTAAAGVDRWAGSKLPGEDEVWPPHPRLRATLDHRSPDLAVAESESE